MNPKGRARTGVEAMPVPSMDKDEFRVACADVGLPVTRAGPWLGMSEVHARRIAGGIYPVPVAVIRLLRLMQKRKLKADKV